MLKVRTSIAPAQPRGAQLFPCNASHTIMMQHAAHSSQHWRLGLGGKRAQLSESSQQQAARLGGLPGDRRPVADDLAQQQAAGRCWRSSSALPGPNYRLWLNGHRCRGNHLGQLATAMAQQQRPSRKPVVHNSRSCSDWRCTCIGSHACTQQAGQTGGSVAYSL